MEEEVNVKTGLVDKRAYLQVLGCLIKEPTLVEDVDRPLTKYDFYAGEEKLYTLIYVSIYNLFMQGCVIIDEFAIDSYLSNFKEQYKIFEDNDGRNYILKCIKFASLENYDMNYHIIRKLSLLRYYESKGLDTRFIYDSTKSKPNEQNLEVLKFNKTTEIDIVEQIENLFVLQPRADFCSEVLTESAQAGKGIADLVESFLSSPDYGYSFTSNAFNTICRGARKGKFYLRSASTGSGKTRNFLMDACNFSIPYTYDINEGKFVFTGHQVPTLFIGVEGSIQEFQQIILATVSGVNENHIVKGEYEDGELDRVRQAAIYIESSPLYLVYCDDYSITDIENIAKKYVYSYNIEIFIFDYLQSSLRLMTEITGNSRVKLQEYQLLIIFSTRLKALAERLNICVISGTQLSAEADEARYKTNLVLQGSKAVANKVDIGVIISKPNNSERKKIEMITKNLVGVPPVTHLYWLYKVRAGEITSVIICCNLNLSNMRLKECFICDFDFNLIELDMTKIEVLDDVVKNNSIDINEARLTEKEQIIETNEENFETKSTKFTF